MEGEGQWEDALDVDDSDLPSLPPLRPCSEHPLPSHRLRQPQPPPPPPPPEQTAAAPPPPRRIPGPAGAVQAVMHRQAAAARDRGDLRLELVGDDRRAVGDGGEEVDEDFLQNPWLRALDFLGGYGTTSLGQSISSIRAPGGTERVPKLMGIVKSCKPNGLGDLFVTLKDPTGAIGASIHRRVLMEGNFGGDLSVGCVLILKQVAVFSPVRSAVYLNVTYNNVVKLFGKDSGPLNRQILPTLTGKCPPPGKILDDRMEPVGRACLLSRGSERIATVESQRDLLVASRTADRRNMEILGSVQIHDREVVKSVRYKRTMDDRQVECLSGISTCAGKAAIKSVGSGTALRASPVIQSADNIYNEEVIQNSNLKTRIDSGKTESPSGGLGYKMNIPSAATSLWRGMSWSRLNQEADDIAVEQVGSSSNMEVDRARNKRPTRGSSPKTSCTTAPNSTFSKPPDRVMESRSLISKVSVAQWTDEQLSELFCDYQDDADFF